MDTKKFWGYDGQIQLPHAIRVYIDGLAHEFGDITINQKLLELAYAFLYGYDMKKAVREKLKDNRNIDILTVNNAIVSYIQHLRTGAQELGSPTYLFLGDREKLTSDVMYDNIELLKQELLLRVRLTITGQPYLIDCHWDEDAIYFDESKTLDEKRQIFQKPTPISMFDFTEDDIRRENPWVLGLQNGKVNYLSAVPDRLYSREATWLLNIDFPIVIPFENANGGKDEQLMLEIPPEPFSGNPLTAKVIILSLSPGYVERANRLIPSLLTLQTEEEINKHKDEQLELEARSFFIDRNTRDKDKASYRDVECMIGDWYWYDIFEKMRKESDGKLPKEKDYDDIIYNNVALVQYMGYASKKYKEFSRNMLLPSQRFTQHLMWYFIFNRPDTLVVVSRSETKWYNLLGEEAWQKLIDDGRLILRKKTGRNGKQNTHPGQSFTKVDFENNGYEKIIDAISSCHKD